MTYVDGFVLPVSRKRIRAYQRLARKAGKIWMEYGALEYCQCVADDVPAGKSASFSRSLELKPGETVVFSWIVYRSRKDRDRINAEVFVDPRVSGMDPTTMPFDGKRLIFNGFKTLVRNGYWRSGRRR